MSLDSFQDPPCVALRVLWGVGFEDVEVEAALNLNPKCRNPGPRLDDVYQEF